VKPGDPFVAKFYEISTVRKERRRGADPTNQFGGVIVSAGAGQTPGAAMRYSVRVVATIAAKHEKTVDLAGPDGAMETVNVTNPSTQASAGGRRNRDHSEQGCSDLTR
jgi:hypothetical protein